MTNIRDWMASHNEDAVLFHGYEDAIVGFAERCGQPALLVYDAEKCLEILRNRDGMSEDEAIEWFEFNTLGCWAGDNTPLFLWRWSSGDDQHGDGAVDGDDG